MSNTNIQLRKSGVTGNVPDSLAYGELALNYADGKLYYKNGDGVITYISSGATTNSFATVNANSSLIIATSNTDIISLAGANNITITSNGISKSITIGAKLTNLLGIDDSNIASSANAAYQLANLVSTAQTVASYAAGQANYLTVYANAAYTQANAATLLAQSAYDYANTISGGATPVSVNYLAIEKQLYTANASQTNFYVNYSPPFVTVVINGSTIDASEYSTATANTVILNNPANAGDIIDITGFNNVNSNTVSFGGGGSGIDQWVRDTANSAKSNTIITQGVDAWQNTQITAVNNFAAGAYTKANTAQNTIDYNIGLIGAAYTLANTANSLAQSAYNSSNNVNSFAQSAYATANGANGMAVGAYDAANGANGLAAGAYNTANGANGLAASAYNTANGANGLAAGAYNQANTNATNITAVNGYAASAYNKANNALPLTGGSITGSITVSQDVSITGNLYLGGNTTTISTNNITLNDSLIYLANENPANTVDIGIVGHFTEGHYQHTGVVRNHLNGNWVFFSNVSTEPTTTINFAEANLTLDSITTGGIVTPSATINGKDWQTVENTQNTNITTANNAAWAAYAAGNTNATNITLVNQFAQSAYNQANVTVGVDATQNTLISIIQGVDTTQNSRISIIEGVDLGQNTLINIIQGVDTWQNNQITLVNQFAQSAYTQANGANGMAVGAYAAANTNATNIAAVNGYATSAYATANGANGLAAGAYALSNTNSANITAVNGYAVSAYTTANGANGLAAGAYNKANNALANTTGTFAGDLTTTGNIIISTATSSYSVGTGSLRVNGGVGVTGNVYADKIYVNGLYWASNGNVISTSSGTTSTNQFNIFKYVATNGQTTFSGPDSASVSLNYTAGAIIVTLNGLTLKPGSDYTATNGSSIVLSVAADLNDELNIYGFTSTTVNTSNTLSVFSYTAAASQTSFGGVDTNGNSLGYVPGNLFTTLNGITLRNGVDYTAANGSYINLTFNAAANDEVVVYTFGAFNVANTYTKAEANTLFAPVANTYTKTEVNALIASSSTAGKTLAINFFRS